MSNADSKPAAASAVEPSVRPHCSHCGFPLPASDSGLRHYGTHTAHQENECLRLLHAEIERLRAEVAKLQEPVEDMAAWRLRFCGAVAKVEAAERERCANLCDAVDAEHPYADSYFGQGCMACKCKISDQPA